MTFNLRLALLGLLSISATVTTERADASEAATEPCACAGPCLRPDALPQLPPAPVHNFESFIIDTIIDDATHA